MEETRDRKIGTHENERTVLYKTKSLDGTKPNTNPIRAPYNDLQSRRKILLQVGMTHVQVSRTS